MFLLKCYSSALAKCLAIHVRFSSALANSVLQESGPTVTIHPTPNYASFFFSTHGTKLTDKTAEEKSCCSSDGFFVARHPCSAQLLPVASCNTVPLGCDSHTVSALLQPIYVQTKRDPTLTASQLASGTVTIIDRTRNWFCACVDTAARTRTFNSPRIIRGKGAHTSLLLARVLLILLCKSLCLLLEVFKELRVVSLHILSHLHHLRPAGRKYAMVHLLCSLHKEKDQKLKMDTSSKASY